MRKIDQIHAIRTLGVLTNRINQSLSRLDVITDHYIYKQTPTCNTKREAIKLLQIIDRYLQIAKKIDEKYQLGFTYEESKYQKHIKFYVEE